MATYINALPRHSLTIRKQLWRCRFTRKFPVAVIINHLYRFSGNPHRIRLSTEVQEYKYKDMTYAKSLRWADLCLNDLNEHVDSSKTFPNGSVLPLWLVFIRYGYNLVFRYLSKKPEQNVTEAVTIDGFRIVHILSFTLNLQTTMSTSSILTPFQIAPVLP